MNGIIKFGSSRLASTGKKGVIKLDGTGYCDLVIGALNVYNSVNEFYTAEGARKLYENSSGFMRRLKNGNISGEVGHPKWLPGMTEADFARRMRTIEETNICCHFKDIWLDVELGKKMSNGGTMIAVMGSVTPSGSKAEELEKALANPHENVNFSVRGVTADYNIRGQIVRVLETIYTYDKVREQGVKEANKWDSPACESYQDVQLTRSLLKELMAVPENMALESDRQFMTELDTVVNRRIEIIDLNKPIYLKW